MTKTASQKKKKNRLTARFYSILITTGILVTIGLFFWQSTQAQIPNLHGWESIEVMSFGQTHNITLEFEFVYSEDIAPTLVVNQSIPPGAAIVENMTLIIEISKGIEVR